MADSTIVFLVLGGVVADLAFTLLAATMLLQRYIAGT